MEIPRLADDDPLAEPIRARLFQALGELRRAATTPELARRVGRHPNSVRVQLARLAEAGLVERRTVRRARGRPRDEWALASGARPGGEPPQAHGQLARWLARAVDPELATVESRGREIGRELAPQQSGRPFAAAMEDALSSLGFAPRQEREGADRLRYVLGNCPYRDAVRENQPAICTLHRGITRGLLDRLEPRVGLAGFVPKDPYAAGCLIELAPAGGANGSRAATGV